MPTSGACGSAGKPVMDGEVELEGKQNHRAPPEKEVRGKEGGGVRGRILRGWEMMQNPEEHPWAVGALFLL